MKSGTDLKATLKAILFAGLIAGTLDGAAAVVSFLIHGGSNPARVFVYIASGVFGRTAFTAGDSMMWWGLLFHYFIATSWTALFFLASPHIVFLSKNRIWSGVGYGLVVWLAMTRVVLPLSNVPPQRFVLSRAIEGAAILTVMIGLPISYMSSRHYAQRGKRKEDREEEKA